MRPVSFENQESQILRKILKTPSDSQVTDRIADVIQKFDKEHSRDLGSYYRDLAAAVVLELGLSVQWAVRIGQDGAACLREKQAVHQLAAEHPGWHVVHRVVSEWATGG
jgi:hypothetical protein